MVEAGTQIVPYEPVTHKTPPVMLGPPSFTMPLPVLQSSQPPEQFVGKAESVEIDTRDSLVGANLDLSPVCKATSDLNKTKPALPAERPWLYVAALADWPALLLFTGWTHLSCARRRMCLVRRRPIPPERARLRALASSSAFVI
jgi:hypothetical protein